MKSSGDKFEVRSEKELPSETRRVILLLKQMTDTKTNCALQRQRELH
jgi:hypothetical protein